MMTAMVRGRCGSFARARSCALLGGGPWGASPQRPRPAPNPQKLMMKWNAVAVCGACFAMIVYV